MIDSSTKVNAMTPVYTAQLGLTPRSTIVGAQKINGLPLKPHKMITAGFSVIDKLERIRFFKKTFLLADTSMEVVLRMPFSRLATWTSTLK